MVLLFLGWVLSFPRCLPPNAPRRPHEALTAAATAPLGGTWGRPLAARGHLSRPAGGGSDGGGAALPGATGGREGRRAGAGGSGSPQPRRRGRDVAGGCLGASFGCEGSAPSPSSPFSSL